MNSNTFGCTKEGKHISEKDALAYTAGYAVGLDMTARDIQAEAKKKGHPWSVAKGFDSFAPLGEMVPVGRIKDPQNLTISLKVNNLLRSRQYSVRTCCWCRRTSSQEQAWRQER